jgi:hypothetical protein
MDSSYTLLLYPEIEYNDAFSLAAISRVIEAGLNVRFELNKDSAVLAFNRGITAEAIITSMMRLSQNRIDENLLFTLRDWEKSHREITLRKGLVLTLSPERRYLAETKPLAGLITETLAPGVYMLPENMEEKVTKALQKAGASIIARREASHPVDDNAFTRVSRNFFPRLYAGTHTGKIPSPAPEKNDAEAESPAFTLLEGFHSTLNRMNPGAEERGELAARIDRRLVLCESQLKDVLVRYEKLEARGMDYAGKALIVKQAISMKSPVEVTWPGKGKQERIYGIPKAMEKAGGESILVIEPVNEKETIHAPGDAIRIPLGKISLLRRIKKSIFEI